MALRRADGRPADEKSDSTAAGSGRLRGADAFRLHAALAAGLTICVAAFVTEVVRALDGNTLSWAYVFEWPIFAGFALYMWWNLLHGNDGSRRRSRPARPAPAVPSDDAVTAAAGSADPSGPEVAADDPDLAAWRAYLRGMEADEARGPGTDGPGPG